ncbi:hypothetical protein F5B22DRAFT_620100 [Xylaria bambusicola]|uniref:uncharacterized protein n=1 Tax=Xylaria bambusicola TaxID=326684 RepID=UPI0020076EA7|nr:uncharacterized protein F5B22DRAFT_620100 [Xylaria bambusicola]KAI0508723.1 hypothetical protein F5B22DRAFT_620100 [Xylaria bambusicola]
MDQTSNEQPNIANKSQPGQDEGKIAPSSEKAVVGKHAPLPAPATQQNNGKRKQRRGFCNPIFTFFSAIASLFVTMISISAAAGQGMSKAYWHIPLLYGDETTREWPDVTGFRNGCVAGAKSLFFGIYDGITGLVVLPYKGARRAGIKGFGVGILHGIGGLIFKPLSGFWAFFGHPVLGLHRHFYKNREDPLSHL